MIVPDFWAEARRQHREPGRQITVRRFGWSTVSAAEAELAAEQRAEEALRRLIAGERLRRREPKVPYNGAEGVPIREEVLSRHGEEVITRNAYGAHCLNSPNALFADVDFEPHVSLKLYAGTFALLAMLSVLIGITSGRWGIGILLGFASLIAALPTTNLAVRFLIAAQGGAQQLAMKRLQRFLARRPEWNVRVYQTPAGLRLLATHRRYEPSEPEVGQFFRAIGADPIYVRMCLNQQCFRARLTAKPWRIGISSHMRPQPGVWPVAPERLALRTSWVAAYEARASGFASCKYVESLGSGMIHERLRSVVELHDHQSRAHVSSVRIA